MNESYVERIRTAAVHVAAGKRCLEMAEEYKKNKHAITQEVNDAQVEQWLQTCKWNMDMAKTQYGPPGSQLVEQSKKRRRSKGSKQKWT